MENSKKGSLPILQGITLCRAQCPVTRDQVDKLNESSPICFGYRINHCSQSDWVFLLNRGAMTWKSSKQPTWLQNFIGDLGVVPTISEPIEIFRNNTGAIDLMKEPKDHGKSRHIKRKFYYIRHRFIRYLEERRNKLITYLGLSLNQSSTVVEEALSADCLSTSHASLDEFVEEIHSKTTSYCLVNFSFDISVLPPPPRCREALARAASTWSRVVNANNVSAQLAGIPTLNGMNYAMWKESVEIVLGCMDLDHALRMERPNSTTENPNTDKIEKWDRSNRMCLMIMKRSIPSTFRGSITEGTNAKNFLKEIEQFFAKNAKTEASNTLMKLVTMRYKEKGNIREYIMEMSNLNGKLKELKLELSDDLLVHLILISLPAQFGQFVVSYNTQKDKWTLNELMSHLVQEEERLKRDKKESAQLASTSQDKRKKRAKGTAENVPKQKKHKKQDKEFTCFFCKKAGHIKKECPKYAAWREKHGKYLTFVCTEVNLAYVSEDTWWVDSGATAHISMSMQGCLWSWSPTSNEKFIYVGDGAKVKVKAIGTFRLLLKTGVYLDLVETFIVPSFRRNLISVSCLDKFGYSCLLGNNKVGFYLNSNLVGTGSLNDKLYMLETVALDNEVLHSVAKGNKRKLNEDSAILWHKRLGHISKQRIQRLIDERILNSIDLTNFQVCVECIKGKQTNARRLGSNRATDVLELIHTDICGPFPTASWNGQRYFITFIDDYSRYGYLYLIHEKSQSLDVFKDFKAEVELQLGKKIKAVRSDRGGEYYGRYDGSGEQRPGPFALFLKECGIVSQYTMPGSPRMNGVAERRNRTLKDMVRSKKPSLNHLHVWGCPAEARAYNPHERKLDSRTINKIRNVVFEEEKDQVHISSIPTSAIDNDQVLIPIVVQNATPVQNTNEGVPLVQDNSEVPPTVEQTQQTQEVPLRRSTRERRNEMKSMKDNDVWDLVELPKDAKPIGYKWIFKTKKDSNGNIERYKARLVAKGFTQKEGIDYKETFSPVSSKDSFRTIMALVAHYDLELHQMDVKTAFLNGNIDETIYMTQPENFALGDSKSMVCRLKKSIYGLKQASRQWYLKLHQVITSFGYEVNLVEDCVYHKFSGSSVIFLILYVDDILITTNDLALLHDTKKFLAKHFEMKHLGDASFVLGIQILRDRSRGILRLSQTSYIDKVLDRFGMLDSKSRDTPIAKGDKFSLKQCPKNELEIKEMQKFPYASAVGSLMYAQVCTRPDIAFIVGVLGRYLSNPGMDHWRAAKRVMRYLKKTRDYMLTYRKSDSLEIVGYSDSDFGGCQDTGRSTSGYVYILAGGAISWKSVKQTLVASSTMAAEFVACYEASNHGIWLRNFVTGLRIVKGVERPLKLFCDNNSAVLYSNNNRSTIKSKHIDIKFLVVKERVQNGQIVIEHMGTNSMLADPLSKALVPKVFHEHTKNMGVVLDDTTV
ncbi:hypothetical protein OSB04_019739 [Centaurea solstitialis]|uniref:Retrovirus-related Pol polyprotein from transposon TNT 1-94 n=1 Tax=Centaurea solstitialis TaxID=347529 RepID=A0AA38T2D4_9ASTR|nr:hypothetical protein OSB04_019739 [Centaurea solstitialis]